MIVDIIRSPGRDRLWRVPILLFNLAWIAWEAWALRASIAVVAPVARSGHFYADCLARTTLLLFLLTLTWLHATRQVPFAGFANWRPRVDAVLGLTLGYFVLLLPTATAPWWTACGTFLIFAGNLFCLAAALQLGGAIGIVPEARALVTEGIYRHIRHPLYLGEAVAFLGVFFQFRSWQAAAILGTQFLFQLRRIGWEEQLLAARFPAYAAYRARTAALLPGVW